jgi:glycosyltransferase involved in cell wall biosynthesis
VYYLPPTKNKFLKLRSLISNTRHDVLYLNGFFSFSYSIKPLLAYRTLKSNEQPVILAPRGGFSEGALKIKKLKKNAFIKLVRLLKIYRNIIFHASSNFEFDDILKTLITTKSFIKVAIDMPEMSKGGFKNYIPPSDKKSDLRLIFVSRISPKKNLDYALKVLSNIKCKVSFDIYGPLEDEDYWEDCRQLIKNLPENVECRYCGILMPEKVKIVFSGYDIFLFPTHGENYGHVIAESLSVGTPVLISDQTPWKCLDKEGLGWEFSLNDESSFIQVINQFAQTSAEER